MFSRLFSSKRINGKHAEPQADCRSLSPSTESASVSASAATGAPGSPTRVALPASRSPSPVVDPVSLQDLFTTCPPKTLHTYTMSRLKLATPEELHALASFFAALEPPPRLHCVRCHKGYYEIENNDRSCTMPHDDESAEVEHVGYARNKAAGAYETRWDCCGRTVEGDGDLGPPSGWCYEGKHTMDRKRARYRNDSTPTNDLLQSCDSRGCHRKQYAKARTCIPVPEDARSTRSVRSEPEPPLDAAEQPKKRNVRKRTLKQNEGDDPATGEGSVPKKKKRKVAQAA